MEGILILAAVMFLFALIASNRFRMLRKMADQVFIAFDELSIEKYEKLSRFIDENRDLPGLQKLKREANELEELLRQAQRHDLSVDQRVETENKSAELENRLLSQMAAEESLSQQQQESLSDIRQSAEKPEEVKKQYNDTVKHYNNAVFLFPSNVFALIFGYKRRKIFTESISYFCGQKNV